MMWCEEISEGPTWGPQPNRARLGVLACPGGLFPPGAPPYDIIYTRNSEIFRKIHIKFSGHSDNFIFFHFLLQGKFRKQTKLGIYFI